MAAAADDEIISMLGPGTSFGLEFILIGPEEDLRARLSSHGLDPHGFTLVHEKDPRLAARTATRMVRQAEADILMKGLLHTADFLHPVLDRADGIRASKLLSHIAVFEMSGRLIFLSDAAMNIAPGLDEKAEIIRHAALAARRLGVERPKAAVLGAQELVNAAMPATIEAAALSKMAERGQLGQVIVDGPLSLDNAISLESAQHKGLAGEVAGAADILIAPEIVCGNVLYKAFVNVACLNAAGVVVGATAPIVLTSRSDKAEIKLNSLMLAAFLCDDH